MQGRRQLWGSRGTLQLAALLLGRGHTAPSALGVSLSLHLLWVREL